MPSSKRREDIVYSHLTGEDQEDLVWFFGVGQVVFDRSPMGGMLHQAELYCRGRKRCPDCRGTGFAKGSKQVIKDAVDKIERWRLDNPEQLARGRILPGYYDDGLCEACHGRGEVPKEGRHRRRGALTAQPTGHEPRPTKSDPDGRDLELFGAISHRISRVDIRHVRVLEGFFGIGENWRDDEQRGRIFGIYALTPAGKKLLKMATTKTVGNERLPPETVIETEATLQEIQPKKRRAALLTKCRSQAEAMLRDAEEAWSAVEARKRFRPPKRVRQSEPRPDPKMQNPPALKRLAALHSRVIEVRRCAD